MRATRPHSALPGLMRNPRSAMLAVAILAVLAALLGGRAATASASAFPLPDSASAPSATTSASALPVIAREGSVDSPVKPGVDPARDLLRAEFRLGMEDGVARARVTLGAEPTAATTSDLMVAWGEAEGTVCQLSSGTERFLATHETGGGDAADDDYWRRTGAVIEVNVGLYGWQDLNCAVAVTIPTDVATPDPELAYDFAVAGLTDIRATPQGALQAQVVGNTTVYAGTTTALKVRVSNPGTAPVTGASLRLAGNRIRAAARKVGAIAAGKSRVVKLKVKARPGKRKRQVNLIATGRGPSPITTRQKAILDVRTQGRKPRPGRYVGNNGRISFRVTRAGVVKNIRLRVVGVCNPGAHTWADWNTLPKAKVNRFGWVDRRYRRGKGFNSSDARLTARFVGGRVLEGHYQYVTSLCHADVRFKARRTGR